MVNGWHGDIESLEAISQDDFARGLFRRMADLSRRGRLEPFLEELHSDADLDHSTKELVAEIAENSTFLHVVDDYLRRTATLH